MNKLSTEFDQENENQFYWTDGENVFHRGTEIGGADLNTFEHFYGIWAKDKKTCYSGATRINSADAETFKALNFTYAKDKNNVYSLVGKIKDADPSSFEICDDGKHSLGKSVEWVDKKMFLYDESYVPYGYGKDVNHVYYYNFSGKTKIVKKAETNTFVSLNDSNYGIDENNVFYGFAAIPKANPKTWKKLKEKYFFYSRDGNKIFYLNRLIKDADAESFEVVETPIIIGTPPQLAKDKISGFNNSSRISFDELQEKIDYRVDYYNKITEKLK